MADISATIDNLPAGDTKKAILQIWSTAQQDVTKFKEGLEAWFDETMDRLNGVYTRYSQLFAFLFGLAVAIFFNADSIAIGKTLYMATPEQRSQLERIAADASETGQNGTLSHEEAQKILTSLKLPIGWRYEACKDDECLVLPNTGFAWLQLVLGILVTGICVSFGSKFWFDVLNKFIDIRATGPKPKEEAKT